ncbi:MAG: transcriptional repressor [Bacteroidales bacterium]|nr:transcriptional repressor [Bacteroidales bacterium]
MNAITNLNTPSEDEFRTLLRKHNLKATRQRIAVHRVMTDLGHASADMVSEELVRRGETRVTVASVYNILSQLADVRIYTRRMSGNSKMYFDVNMSRHLHLYDRENNTYRDVYDEELMDLIRSRLKKRKFKGFTVEDIDIQLIARPTKKTRLAL